jgi:hypothetical protein
MHVFLPEELCALLQVSPTYHSFAISDNQKRIRESEIRPSQWQGAYLVGLRIGKEHTLFSPGKVL